MQPEQTPEAPRGLLQRRSTRRALLAGAATVAAAGTAATIVGVARHSGTDGASQRQSSPDAAAALDASAAPKKQISDPNAAPRTCCAGRASEGRWRRSKSFRNSVAKRPRTACSTIRRSTTPRSKRHSRRPISTSPRGGPRTSTGGGSCAWRTPPGRWKSA
jgi:hypothetical protein